MARIGGAARRAQFVATAQQLFYTNGYANTSINDIIRAVGVSKGAFYHHFESKTAVLEAIVAEIVAQLLANLKAIVADESLTAISKWQKVVQLSNNWKLERKAEMIEAFRPMMMDENILLRHKIRAETMKVGVSEMSEIIAQGVAEHLFDVQHIPETAEILLNIINNFGDAMSELILHPEKYDDPATLALQKNAALQTAVERLLGAPDGSMPSIDNKTLIAWFDNA